MTDMEIGPPQTAHVGCKHLEWRDVALMPEEMPEMEAYCLALKQFLPKKLLQRIGGICDRCIIYSPYATQSDPEHD